MCLGIPMRVVEVHDGERALVDSFGIRLLVGTKLVGPVQLGEQLLVHAGYAIERIDEQEAQERLKLWEEILSQNET